MRLIVTYSISILISFTVKAQNDASIDTTDSKKPLQEIISDIEAQTELEFFYKTEWIDSVSIDATFKNEPLDSLLHKILTEKGLLFYRHKNQIILTRDIMLITHPEISTYLDTKEPVISTQKGLVFSKDYKKSTNTKNDIIEVGSRNGTFKTGNSNVAGYIKEQTTGTPLEGALVYTRNPLISTTTDANGFYFISLPKGKTTLTVQHLGMKTWVQSVVLFSDGKLNIELEKDVRTLQEVTIKADRDANVKQVIMGLNKINVEETKNIPILLGEKDIMKIATTTAGVQSLGEGASGFNVRGGKSDQNLILLNKAIIYNADHFLGFFSVFNSDAIEEMSLYKSSIPAMHGGRLSSVFDIESTPGEKEKFEAIGGISPITSRLTLKIPVIKEKAGLTVAGRTTYSDWLLNTVDNGKFSENKVSFSDLIMNYDHKLNDNNNLMISGYISNDKLRLSSDTLFQFSDFSYQNIALSAEWKHKFSDKLTGNLNTTYSDYNYTLSFDESESNSFTQDFGIKNNSIATDFTYYLSDKQELSFGIGTTQYKVNPGTKKGNNQNSITDEVLIPEEKGIESFAYLSSDYTLNDKISFSLGARYSVFNALGPKEVYTYDETLSKSAQSRTGSKYYGSGEIIETYHGIEPRISARYSFNELTSVKVSYNRNRQYVNTLSNSVSLSPTDIWRLSDSHILPQISDQYSIGFYKNLFDKEVEVSLESYYKRLQNLLDIKIGSQFLLNQNIETAVLQGPGKSYGIELSIKKSSGKLNGWVNYVYARTFIQLEGDTPEETINGGTFYPTNYDKPHTINLIANYKFNRRLSVSYNFNYSTGRPTTFPTAVYEYKGNKILHYSERNAFRIPDYIRMDIGVSLDEAHRINKFTHTYWSFSIYNILGRDNPYSVFFDITDDKVSGHKLVVFGSPIPTLSFNFRF